VCHDPFFPAASRPARPTPVQSVLGAVADVHVPVQDRGLTEPITIGHVKQEKVSRMRTQIAPWPGTAPHEVTTS
jgi:hypothetical protein